MTMGIPDAEQHADAPPADEFVVVVTLPGTPEHFTRTCNGAVLVGRSNDCQIQLSHPLVSRHHAELASLGERQFHVCDLGSRNGTTVNGQVLRDASATLSGDVSVQIGPYLLLLAPPATEDSDTVLFDARNVTTRVTLDRGVHAVLLDGKVVVERLSGLEYRLLDALAAAAPNLVENKALGDAVWEAGQWDSYMLHNLVRRVRRKMEQSGVDTDELIVSAPGVGYRLA